MAILDTSGQDVVLTPKKSKKKIYISVVVLLALGFSISLVAPAFNTWSSADTSISLKRLRLATVTRGDFIRDLSVQGRVVAAASPRLYSTAQGTITYFVDSGDTVSKEQILATIASPELTNKLKQEQASIQSLGMELDRQRIQAKTQALKNQKSVDLAKVTLIAAEREKRRADKAYQSNSISQIDYEKAQDDLENAKLVYKHAVKDTQLSKESLEFEVRAKKLNMERQNLLVEELTRKVDELTVRSPVSGIVGNLAVEQKNQVAQYQAILSVVDLSAFELEILIPESYADDLAIGMDVEVNLNGEIHNAKLVTISPEIENNQVTGRVRFSSEKGKQPKGLRQNQRLTTRILLESKQNVLMVPRGQFLESSNGKIAYLVRNGLAKKTKINIGARSLSNVEVISGLREGDQIIVSSTDIFQGVEHVQITN